MADTSYYRPAGYPEPPTRPELPAIPGPPVQRAVAPGPGASGPILLAFAPAVPQRRVTVLFRALLAIPHFFALYALGIVASFVAVFGWFGALALGRLPGFADTFLSGFLRWYCRVAAYLLLLTDAYPPFSLEYNRAYPVRVEISPGRLNRLAVLFRIILAIPAAIISSILIFGLTTIVVFIAWLITLVVGKLPGAAYQAFAAVLRYSVRYSGYLYLLTDAYPAGLLGDKPDSAAWAAQPVNPGYGYPAPPPGYGAPGYGASGYGAPGYGAPGYGVSGYGAPGYGATGYGAPGYGAPGYGATGYGAPGYGAPGYGAPGSGVTRPGYGAPNWQGGQASPAQPGNWQLILSGGAKRLVVLIVVLGFLTLAGEGAAAGAVIAAAIHRQNEIHQLDDAVARHNGAVAREQQAAAQVTRAGDEVTSANGTLSGLLNSYADKANTCVTLTCFDADTQTAADDFEKFGRVLRTVAVPAGASAIAKNKLMADVDTNEKDLRFVAEAVSYTEFLDRSTPAENAASGFDKDYSALVKSLNQEVTVLSRQAGTLNREASQLNARAMTLSVPAFAHFAAPPSAPSHSSSTAT